MLSMVLKLYFLLLFFILSSSHACEVVMGYRTSERLPFIAEAPNNEGLYYSLYSRALADIGCQLKVLRAPKKRILHMIKSGEIDFYPGLGFSDEREEYIHYILNVNNGEYALYENGNLAAKSKKNISCSASNTAPLRIGMRGGPMHSNYFKGSVDDLIIYNRGLSQKEIEKLASGTYDIEANLKFNTDFSSVLLSDTIYFNDNVFELNKSQRTDLLSIAEYLNQGANYHLVIDSGYHCS